MSAARIELDLSNLDKLRKGAARKAVRIAVNRASAPVKAAVVAGAERLRRFGYLAKAQRIRVRIYGGKFVSVIGPTRKFVRTKGKITRGPKKGEARRFRPANYAHLVELGTEHGRARPFLMPALAATKGTYARLIRSEVKRELEKVMSGGAGRKAK